MLDGLRNGNEELGITAVRGAAAVAALEQSQQKWEAMKQDADAILASSRQLFAAQSAATALGQGSAHMLDDSRKLFDAFSSFGSVSDAPLDTPAPHRQRYCCATRYRDHYRGSPARRKAPRHCGYAG
nr:hypothetical protein [Staphylococcus aureus]